MGWRWSPDVRAQHFSPSGAAHAVIFEIAPSQLMRWANVEAGHQQHATCSMSHKRKAQSLQVRTAWGGHGYVMPSVPSLQPIPFQRQSYPCADDRFVQPHNLEVQPQTSLSFRDVYLSLIDPRCDGNAQRKRALKFLESELARVPSAEDDLPDSPEGLAEWMSRSTESATQAYRDYLEGRKAGQPRRFFTSRAHALFFIQSVAPTKLVDGSWLFGTLRHQHDPRMAAWFRPIWRNSGMATQRKITSCSTERCWPPTGSARGSI